MLLKIIMSSQRQQGRNDANKHHKNRALHSVTSGISSGSAGASASESRSASIRGLGLVSPLVNSLLPILMIKRRMTRTLVEASQVMCGVLIMH